jgi:hypothetical protein
MKSEQEVRTKVAELTSTIRAIASQLGKHQYAALDVNEQLARNRKLKAKREALRWVLL